MNTPLKHHIAERHEMTTVSISNAAGLDDRLKAVQAMAKQEPLVWAFKKPGDTITGTYVYAMFVNNTHLLWLKDAKNITHRVNVPYLVAKELFGIMKNKHFEPDVIISIQFIGIDKNQYGEKRSIFKLIIDQPEVLEPIVLEI